MNASLQAVYIHHVVRDMTYKIQISAVNRIGEGTRSNAIVVGKLALFVTYTVNQKTYHSTLMHNVGILPEYLVQLQVMHMYISMC